jgi:MFS family permease
VKWGNYAGLVVFTMEPAMIFLMTLYLQHVLGFPADHRPHLRRPGPGVRSRRGNRRTLHRALGSRKVLAGGLSVQGVATLLLVFLGTDRATLAVLIPALFIGFFGHVTSIVTFMVTGTSCLPNKEQGLATGLTSLTQQVGITIGIPVLRSIAANADHGADRRPPRADRERGRNARQRGPHLVRVASARRPPHGNDCSTGAEGSRQETGRVPD